MTEGSERLERDVGGGRRGGARVVHSAARLVVSRLSLTPLAQACGRNE